MVKYLAKYTVQAYIFDGGAWMNDPESHKPEYRFEAKNEEEAKRLARDHIKTFREEYFNPTSTLDQLLQIQEMNIENETQ